MEQIFLTRRNLITLLSKLDRRANGEQTVCTLMKNDTGHSQYPCSTRALITAVEDKDYYTDRDPGRVHPKDAT